MLIVRHIDVPVLMNCQRLLKACAVLRRLPVHFDNSPACPNTRQTLVGLTATMSASSIMNPAIVLVHLPVAFPPVVELAGSDIEPPDEPPAADLGLLRPAPDEI